MNKWVSRAEVIKKRGPKFVPGSCVNCGSTKHKKKDCLERPRKHKAKYNNSKIIKDKAFYLPKRTNKKVKNFLEKPKPYNNEYESKRDTWGKEDVNNYELYLQEYELERKIKNEAKIDDGKDDYIEGVELEDTNKDVDTRKRTNHSLRDRNQIPHYLADHIKEHDKDKRLEFDEKFMKYTGDSKKFLDQERFALENDIANSVALPTTTEMMFKREAEKKEEREKERLETIEGLYKVNKEEGINNEVEVIYEEDLMKEKNKENPQEEEIKKENEDKEKESIDVERKKKIKKNK